MMGRDVHNDDRLFTLRFFHNRRFFHYRFRLNHRFRRLEGLR